jgi:ornithine cyclodeaminase
MLSLARGEVHQPLRSLMRPPDAPGFLGLMPAHRGGADAAFGLKAVCVFPQNPSRGLDTHVGVVILSSGETGEVLAIANASAITAIRTAAMSALATDLLARHHVETAAIIGTGTQARAHLEALVEVRPFKRIVICGRTRDAAEKLIADVSAAHRIAGSAEIVATASVEEAVRDADVITTVTNSREPVLKREWVRPGTHINAVGSSVKSARELDAATVAASSLFVDLRESTVNESGDYLMALAEGAITPDHIRGAIGEVLDGQCQGRRSPDEITLFKSLGLAIEDLAAAAHIYAKAKSSGHGTWLEL